MQYVGDVSKVELDEMMNHIKNTTIIPVAEMHQERVYSKPINFTDCEIPGLIPESDALNYKIPKSTEFSGNLTDKQRDYALETKSLLELLVLNEYLEGDILKGNVLDWGCGVGTNILALTCFGGYVEAVDIEKGCKEIVRKELLPEDRVYLTEGIKFLQERPQKYDLIAGFTFGPVAGEYGVELLLDFYEVASTSIKPEGKIILTSDSNSFKTIKLLEKEGLGVVSENLPSNVFVGEPAKEPINRENFYEDNIYGNLTHYAGMPLRKISLR